jgi:putative membrane protein
MGLGTMIGITFIQTHSLASASFASPGFLRLFLGGALGASAMILPGVSGGYLLIVMGCYIPILQTIEQLRVAFTDFALAEMLGPLISVILPLGLGIVFGVIVVSHGLRRCLAHWPRQSYALLLGLLIGAIFGLWPFQSPLPLADVKVVKAQAVELTDDGLVYTDSQRPVKQKDLPTELHLPQWPEALFSLFIIGGGFLLTQLISGIGRLKDLTP